MSAVAAALVTRWLVAAAVQVVVLSVASSVPAAVELCKEREVSVTNDSPCCGNDLSPPMWAVILSAAVDSVFGADSNNSELLNVFKQLAANSCNFDLVTLLGVLVKLCEFVLLGLRGALAAHTRSIRNAVRHFIQLLFSSGELESHGCQLTLDAQRRKLGTVLVIR